MVIQKTRQLVLYTGKSIAKAIVRDGFEQKEKRDFESQLLATHNLKSHRTRKEVEDEWLKDRARKTNHNPKRRAFKTGWRKHLVSTTKKRRSGGLKTSMLNSRHKLLKHLNTGGEAQKTGENKPIYDKLWKEKKSKKNSGKQQRMEPSPQEKQAGDCAYWKKKHQPSQMELNRTEFKGAKGAPLLTSPNRGQSDWVGR